VSDAIVPVTDAQGHRLDQIRLTGVTATGYHGVFEHERREGQTFSVDVVVHLDTRRAAASDDLTRTLDYGTLATRVVAVVEGPAYDLIETLAERIAATVLADGTVHTVDVAVHKPQAPIPVPFGDVVVAIRRDRTKLPAAEPYLPPEASAASGAAAATAARPDDAPAGHPRTSQMPVAGAAFAAGPVVPPLVPMPLGAAAAPAGGLLDAGPAGPAPDEQPTTAFVVPELQETRVVEPVPQDAWSAEAAAPVGAPVGDPAAGPALDRLSAVPDAPVDAVLALGANLGNAQETLRQAVGQISRTPGVELVEVSPLARTAAVGGPEQPDILNAVLLVRTTLSARGLLNAVQAVEQAHGRERLEHWGPRTLDVDVILYGSVLAVTEDLELPHPRAHERAFVLQPWAQVDPDAVLPGLGGGPVAALAATAPDRDGVRWLALDWLTAPVPSAQPEPEHPQQQSSQELHPQAFASQELHPQAHYSRELHPDQPAAAAHPLDPERVRDVTGFPPPTPSGP